MLSNQSPARLAGIQMDSLQGRKSDNLATACRLIEKACAEGATLMVLPELFNSGCNFENRAEAFAAAETVPDGESTELLCKLARSHCVYIVASLLEVVGPDLFNTAVLCGPSGFIGKFRKLHPCENEVYWIEPGDLGLPVFHTPLGRIGLLICLDAYYPETFRILAMQGADVVCVPFNSSDVSKTRHLPEPYHTMLGPLCMANAVANHIFVIGTDRIGSYGDMKYAGQSVIVDQWGATIGGPASCDSEEIIYADVDLCDSRRKYFHPTNTRLANRRTDVYSVDLGYNPERYPR